MGALGHTMSTRMTTTISTRRSLFYRAMLHRCEESAQDGLVWVAKGRGEEERLWGIRRGYPFPDATSEATN